MPNEFRVLNQSEYHELNHGVLRLVFQVHNEYGRLCQEDVYKGAIFRRWNAIGKVAREVLIRLTHKQYTKRLYMDLVFEDSLMLETKTVELLTGRHCAQSLNYLLLAGMHHGTLVNLQSVRVEHRFVSTRLTTEVRRDVRIIAEHLSRSAQVACLADCAESVFRDWGGYLLVSLYRDAIATLLNLDPPTRVPMFDGDHLVGHQSLHLLHPGAALVCTAAHGPSRSLEDHLRRLLSHTTLDAIHWLNFNRSTLKLTTISAP